MPTARENFQLNAFGCEMPMTTLKLISINRKISFRS